MCEISMSPWTMDTPTILTMICQETGALGGATKAHSTHGNASHDSHSRQDCTRAMAQVISWAVARDFCRQKAPNVKGEESG